jgi:anti-sigma B factor antagonist
MLTHSRTDDCLTIVLEVASLDAGNAVAAKERFRELTNGWNKAVKIDLSNVDFMDSSGIGALLSLFKATQQQLTLVKPKPTVISVLELLRLHRVFPMELD